MSLETLVRTNSSRQLLPSYSIHLDLNRATPSHIRTTAYEQYAFDYFRSYMATSLSPASPAHDWVQVVLQMSIEEEAVFYAVTAVATAQANVALTTHRILEPPLPTKDQDVAIQQFCKASSALQRGIDEAIQHNAKIDQVLICSVLFMYFELLRSKQHNSIAHLRVGRKIVEGHFQTWASSGTASRRALAPRTREVVSKLIATFDLFEHDAIITNRCESLVEQDSYISFPSPGANLPCAFTSLEQAKENLDALSTADQQLRMELFHIAESHVAATDRAAFSPAVKLCIAHCLSRKIERPSGSLILQRLQHLDRAYEAWLAALNAMGQHCDPERPRLLLLIKIQHFFASFRLRTCTETRESSYDRFTEDFVRMLDLVERFIYGPRPLPKPELDVRTQQWESRMSYSLEGGILPTLALISFKCRDFAVRRHAIKLLYAANRQEAMFHSQSIAYFADTMAGLEEERAKWLRSSSESSSFSPLDREEDLASEVIPEAARFLDVVVCGETALCTRIVFGRFAHERNGEIELLEYAGTGYPMVLQPLGRVITEYGCR